MTRTLTSGMQTAIAASDGTIVHFFALDTSGGTVRFCTAPVDMVWNSETWQGIGGVFAFGAVEETPDPSGQGVDLTLSGVDPAIISLLLENNVRGRAVQIWLAHLDDGAVIDAPLDLGKYLQISDYTITETRPDEGNGTVTVKTRVQSQLALLRVANVVRTNVVSHNGMLKRAELATGDTFFQNSAAIANRLIVWGPIIIGDTSGLLGRVRDVFHNAGRR